MVNCKYIIKLSKIYSCNCKKNTQCKAKNNKYCKKQKFVKQ